MAEVKELTDGELFINLNDNKKELLNLRFQLATGQLENTSRLSQVRKEVARLKTEIRSREISAAESSSE